MDVSQFESTLFGRCANCCVDTTLAKNRRMQKIIFENAESKMKCETTILAAIAYISDTTSEDFFDSLLRSLGVDDDVLIKSVKERADVSLCKTCGRFLKEMFQSHTNFRNRSQKNSILSKKKQFKDNLNAIKQESFEHDENDDVETDCYLSCFGDESSESSPMTNSEQIKVEVEMKPSLILQLKHRNDEENEDTLKRKGFTKQKQKVKKRKRQPPSSRSYACDKCDQIFSKKTTYFVHRRVHKKEEIGPGPYECPKCHKLIKTREYYREHLRKHDIVKQDMSTPCDICGNMYSSPKQLRVHKRRQHPTEEQLKEKAAKPQEFKCEICGKLFKRKANLLFHVRIHSNERPYACSICNKTFRTTCNLYSHKLSHSTDKLLCTLCGKSFKRKHHLADHLRIHEDEEKGKNEFNCEQCGKILKNRITFRNHIRRAHLEESVKNQHVCDVCGKKFRDTYNLKAHQKTLTCMQKRNQINS